MKHYILIFLLFFVSCGKDIYRYPPDPPEFEECTVGTKEFVTVIKKTHVSLPFSGIQKITLYSHKPEFWDQFEGTVHLKDVDWNADWISEVWVKFDAFTVASWDGHEWVISSTLDLMPFISDKPDDPDRLKFEIEIKAEGLKPAKEFIIEVEADFYFCGKNHELMENL